MREKKVRRARLPVRSNEERDRLFHENYGLVHDILFGKKPLRYAASVIGEEDAVQIAFFRLLKAMALWDGDIGDLENYVRISIRRETVGFYLQEKRRRCKVAAASQVGLFMELFYRDEAEDITPADPDIGPKVEKAMRCLNARQKLAVELRYGLNGHRPHSLRKACGVLGVTPERVRQLELAGLKKLKRADVMRELLGLVHWEPARLPGHYEKQEALEELKAREEYERLKARFEGVRAKH